MNHRLGTLTLIAAVLLSTAACTDPREAHREAERVSLNSQLHEVDVTREQVGRALQAHEQRVRDLEEEGHSLQSQVTRLKSSVQAFMLDHKMAVATLAAGAAGASLALDQGGQFTDDARAMAGVVGIVAAGWALFNMDEVTEVASELMKAESRAKALAERQNQVARSLAEEQSGLRQAQARYQDVQGRASAIRTALASI